MFENPPICRRESCCVIGQRANSGFVYKMEAG